MAISEEEQAIPTHLIQKVGSTRIEHIDFSKSTRRFKIPEIVDDKLNDKWANQNIFMLVRNPVDRLLSEFNFQYHILNGKNCNPNAAIISKLKPLPNTFETYIQFAETQNYQCKFLLGRDIADPNPISEKEFQKIILAIEKLPIHLGLTEFYNDFLHMFCDITKLNLKSEFIQRKQTPKMLKEAVTEDVRNQIETKNRFDYRLYEYVKNVIEPNLSKNKLSFETQSTDTFIV